MFEKPVVDAAKCDGCGLCVGVCHQGALVIIAGKARFKTGLECPWCGECEAVCPIGAISCPFEVIFEDD